MLLMKKKKGRGGGNIPIDPGSGSGGGGGSGGSGGSTVSIPLSVERLISGSGVTLVSNGQLLKPGQLFVADLSKVRVFVLGVEQSIFIKALEGRHVDGSIRSILVQFNYNLSFGAPVVGELRLGETRVTVDIVETPVNTIAGFSTYTSAITDGPTLTTFGYPDAVALITDTAHLLNTQAFSPTISSAAGAALGSYFANVETQKESFGDGYWSQFAAQAVLTTDEIILCDQYDRGHWHAVEWARRASSKWFQRACTYRYLTHQVYDGIKQPVDHHKHPKGQALLYWLTGFDPYRTRLHEIALIDRNATFVFTTNIYGNRAMYAGEARPMSILFDQWMEAHRLGFVDFDWADLARQSMRRSLALDPVSGTHTYNTTGLYAGAWTCPKTLGGGIQATQNFMNAMLAMTLIRYHEWFATPAEQTIIENALDLFCNYNDSQYRDQASTYYISEGVVRDPSSGTPSFAGEPTKSFSYVSSTYSQGGPSKAVDLNGFYCAVYSWVGWKKGQVNRKTRADELYETLQRTPHDGNTGPFMSTASFTAIKQFNEVYFQSMHHLYYRSQT